MLKRGPVDIKVAVGIWWVYHAEKRTSRYKGKLLESGGFTMLKRGSVDIKVSCWNLVGLPC